jgi:hypothetical protein
MSVDAGAASPGPRWRKSAGRPEITATRAKRDGQAAKSAGDAGDGRASDRVIHNGGQGAVEIEAERAVRRVGAKGEGPRAGAPTTGAGQVSPLGGQIGPDDHHHVPAGPGDRDRRGQRLHGGRLEAERGDGRRGACWPAA